MQKVFILGIDGATLDLIEPWSKQGKLPTFRKLIKEGCYGNCLSTVHPLTPQAWASFLTGKNPGKHGLYDFGVRKKGSYGLRLTDSRDRKAPALWDYINAYGLKAGIVNVPLTYPPEGLNGFMVSGMHSPSLREAVFPGNLFEKITSRFPDYEIDVMSQWFDSYDIFLEKLNQMMDVRAEMGLHLYTKYKPHLFCMVLVGVDRAQHALWGQMANPLEGKEKNHWKYSQAVCRIYQRIDHYLNTIIELIDKDTVLIIMSDHGFGSLKKDVYLNRYLIQNGFMKLNNNKQPFDIGNPFQNVNWKKTQAYSYGLFGNIYINLKNREPLGIVERGNNYENVIKSLTEALAQLTDPDDGKKVVTKIYRREEVYHGPFVDDAPDLLINMRNYSYITRGGYEFDGDDIFSKPKINHSGNHRLNGVAFFYGNNIKNGFRFPDIQITDFCPTILSILEIPVPEDLDGRVVNGVFNV